MTVRFLYFPLPHYVLPRPCLYTLTPKSFYQQQDTHMSLCCCNAIVCQQGEPVDQEPGWHCQEGWFCTWFRVPHHFAGCRTKVSQPQVNAAMSWLILYWMRRNMSINEFCVCSGRDTLTGRKHMKRLLRWWSHGLHSESHHPWNRYFVNALIKHLLFSLLFVTISFIFVLISDHKYLET